jgi:hypothetical protein
MDERGKDGKREWGGKDREGKGKDGRGGRGMEAEGARAARIEIQEGKRKEKKYGGEEEM